MVILPPITNTLQTNFNDKIKCEINIMNDPTSTFWSFSSDFKQIEYYTVSMYYVGSNAYNFYLNDKTRTSLWFKTSVYTHISSLNVRTNTFSKNTKTLPDVFMMNGNAMPYISKLEA